MIINKKVNKIQKFVEILFVGTAFDEVLFVGFIISSHIITES